jgi:hypothetical protein
MSGGGRRPGPVEVLPPAELKKLRGLTAKARNLCDFLRIFGDRLPPGHPESAREIVRGRIECIVNDYLPLSIQALEAALQDADPEAVP